MATPFLQQPLHPGPSPGSPPHLGLRVTQRPLQPCHTPAPGLLRLRRLPSSPCIPAWPSLPEEELAPLLFLPPPLFAGRGEEGVREREGRVGGTRSQEEGRGGKDEAVEDGGGGGTRSQEGLEAGVADRVAGSLARVAHRFPCAARPGRCRITIPTAVSAGSPAPLPADNQSGSALAEKRDDSPDSVSR